MHQGISRFRKGVVGALASLTATAGLLPLVATGAGAAANFDLTRLAGADRYGTAAAISAASFPTATDVVLATGENFPDALAGNYKAGTAGAPILLTQKSSVPAATQTEVNRLNPQRIWVLGGTDAIGPGGVPTTSGTVTRLAGATRYETAVQANSTGTVGTIGGKPTAILATGDKFADALSAGPGAYAGNFPLYLTPGAPATALHSATKAALTQRGITNVIVMGGTAAISAAVVTELQGMNITVTRVEGADRTETARNFAEWLLTNLAFSNTHMDVARGDLFPDALAGGPHSGKAKSPILLTWTPTEASPGNNPALGALKYASDHKATLTTGHVFGGVAAVAQSAEDAIEAAGGKVGTGAGTTSRPELIAAAVGATVTDGVNAGTTVKFTFDEAVTCDGSGDDFFAIDASNQNRDEGDVCTAVTGDANSVNVRFNDYDTQAEAGTLTLATVDEGAVNDTGGAANPEGDAALNAVGSTSQPAGITAGPDLLNVDVIGSAAPDEPTQTLVEFQFDQTVDHVNDDFAFHLVTTDNDEVVCQFDSGIDTTRLMVLCDNVDVTGNANVAFGDSAIARGYVVDDSFGDDIGSDDFHNNLQADDVTAGNDLGAPNLLSATFNQTATDSGGNPIDTVTLVFNQAITTATTSTGGFQVYYTDTDDQDAAAVASSGVTPNQLLLIFANGDLVNAVGVSIDEGVVVAASGANVGEPNQEDEVGVANTSVATSAGNTVAPELTGVTKAAGVDIFGNPTGGTTYVYTFDEDVDATTVNAALFFVYLADGTKLVAGACTGSEADATDNTVRCSNYTASAVDVPNSVEAAGVLATVDNNAVNADADAGGEENNEGASAVS